MEGGSCPKWGSRLGAARTRASQKIRHRASGTKWSAPRLIAVLLLQLCCCCSLQCSVLSCCSLDCSFLRARTPGFPARPGPAWNGRRGFSGAKKAPERATRAPRGLQDGPRRPRDAQGSLQNANDGRQTAPDAPKTFQDASKSTPKSAPRGQNRQIPIGKRTL